MRLLDFSPRIAITAFIVTAVLLGAFARSFLNGGFSDADQEFEIMSRAPLKGPGNPPIFAYWISGTGGEGQKMLRLLKAVYHPRNRYLLHLDAGSTASERNTIALSVRSASVFRAFGNVDVMGKAYAVDRTGSSAVAATLHGAAVLLKISQDWDWFITLSASDYPIVTQDDLLHAFTSLPRDLNFIDHTADLGWKELDRFDKIVIDPSLYMERNSKFFFVSETRTTPDAFKIFTGSPWVILTRHFLQHCVHGWDNLPRKLLMYFSNVAFSVESYFHTVICNTLEFRNTTINKDLRYFLWDNPPRLDPIYLNQSHYEAMLESGAAFARRFVEGDPVLQKMDELILRRQADGVGFGEWCSGSADEDPCLSWGDINVVQPGPRGKKLRSLVSEIVSDDRLHLKQCLPS